MGYPTECPYCKANLIAEEVPIESRELYGGTHFYRVISIYDREKDATVKWQCPDCREQWDRK